MNRLAKGPFRKISIMHDLIAENLGQLVAVILSLVASLSLTVLAFAINIGMIGQVTVIAVDLCVAIASVFWLVQQWKFKKLEIIKLTRELGLDGETKPDEAKGD